MYPEVDGCVLQASFRVIRWLHTDTDASRTAVLSILDLIISPFRFFFPCCVLSVYYEYLMCLV